MLRKPERLNRSWPNLATMYVSLNVVCRSWHETGRCVVFGSAEAPHVSNVVSPRPMSFKRLFYESFIWAVAHGRCLFGVRRREGAVAKLPRGRGSAPSPTLAA